MYIYKISDRIDTSNAAEFEKSIAEAHDAYGELEIDASDLVYISSAGLRVLLKARKAQGSLTIKNVSPEVYEILDVTGFVDILNVEKA